MAAKTEHKIVNKPRKTNVDTWIHIKRFYAQQRGSDTGKAGKAVPRTTNTDVAQLAEYWDRTVKRNEQH